MQVAERLLTSVVDGTLLSWLPNLGREHAQTASQLNRLPIEDPLSIAWRKYVAAERAWIFECKSGESGFACGMSVMLCIPREPSGIEDVSVGDLDWLGRIDAFGVPILEDRVTSLTIHYLNVARCPPGSAQLFERPHLLMSLPMMLSAWSIYPPNGYRRGWRSLISRSATQSDTLWKWMMQLSAPRLARFEAAILENCMGHPLYEKVVGHFYWALRDLEKKLAQSMVDRFVSHLNPVVAASCLTRYQALYPQEYNWIVGGATKLAWKRRADALKVFPAISESSVFPCLASVTPAGMYSKGHSRLSPHLANTAPVGGDVTFAEIVDQGLPLVNGLVQSFGVRPVAIRALRGVSNRTIELFGRPPLGWEDILRTLDAIAPERHPKSIEQWVSFSVLYMECVRLYQAMDLLHATLARKFMETTARAWMAENAKNWQRAETRWRDGMRGLVDLSDASEVASEVRDIVSGLGLTASERYQVFGNFANLSPTVWRIYVQKLRCTAVAKTRWHDLWTTREIDGVLVRVLDSLDCLEEEGRVMSHCIHTYRDRLQTQRQIAFAIGERGVADRSTVLLKYELVAAHKWHVTIMEHRARFNGNPSTSCHCVAKQLCKELSSERYADLLNQADMARGRRYESAQHRRAPVQGMIRGVRDLTSANKSIDRSQVREPLLMLIAG